MALAAGYFGAARLGGLQPVGLWQQNLGAHVAVASSLMLWGYLARKSGLLDWMKRNPAAPFVATLVLWWTITAFRPEQPSLAWSQYPAGAWPFFSVAIAASLLIFWLASMFSAFPIGASLAALGRESKAIMAHHLFVFALINLALVSTGIVKAHDVDAFYQFNGGWSWPVYGALAIAAPFAVTVWARNQIKLLKTRASKAASMADRAPASDGR